MFTSVNSSGVSLGDSLKLHIIDIIHSSMIRTLFSGSCPTIIEVSPVGTKILIPTAEMLIMLILVVRVNDVNNLHSKGVSLGTQKNNFLVSSIF